MLENKARQSKLRLLAAAMQPILLKKWVKTAWYDALISQPFGQVQKLSKMIKFSAIVQVYRAGFSHICASKLLLGVFFMLFN